MTQKNAIKLFEGKNIRSVWDDELEKWFFSAVDVVAVLTDSSNPADYIKKMRKRDPILSEGWGQLVTPLSIQTAGGRQKMNCAAADGIFRIIQSIPSPKAEPFKLRIAKVAADRLDQMQDPELSVTEISEATGPESMEGTGRKDRTESRITPECKNRYLSEFRQRRV